jgi:hypothetical protein
MSNKPTLLERQFIQAAQMVKGAIEVYPILADDTAPMFQLAVAVIRMDYRRQRAMERREEKRAPMPRGLMGALAGMSSLPLLSPESLEEARQAYQKMQAERMPRCKVEGD